ncbi:MAG: MBL fold metallo-hydrolase [Clostridia bacterium]|nr:MBL fold metallo-hydrolase [Clostridia bacterium]
MENAIYMLCGADEEIEDWHDQDLLNSFIITSKSGKVVVIDGGHRFNAGHLIKRLKEITGEEKPHIDAWFLTHLHEDHINAFLEVMEKRADDVEVERIYHHFTTDIAIQMREGQNCTLTFLDFYRDLPKFKDKVTVVNVGNRIAVGEMDFEVLYTAGETLKVNSCNNNSLVLKLTLAGKTAIFLADCEVEAGRILVQRYGESGKLKADICQMAHHGQCGVERAVYEAIQPTICLWNTPKYLWNNDLGEGYNTAFFKTVEVRGWMNEIGVEKHYVIKDGDQRLVL